MSAREWTGAFGPNHSRVLVEVRLELVEQHVEFGVVELAEGRNICRVDDDRALRLHVGDRRLHQAIGGRAVAHQLPADDTHAARPSSRRHRGRPCSRADPSSRRPSSPGRRIDARQDAEQQGRVGHGSRHRTGGVLAVGDGTMPMRLMSPSVGLMPTSELLLDGETIDPSVSVPTANAQRLAAVAAADPELDPEGLRSSAYGSFVWPPRPLQPRGRMRRSKVGPLAEVRLAENHGAGRAQV